MIPLGFQFFIAFFLGAALGSYWGCVYWRIPNKKSLLPPSACTYCGKELPFYHNIPIISFLVLRRKTACCKQPLSSHYMFFELGCAVLVGLTPLISFYATIGLVILGIFIPLLISILIGNEKKQVNQ